MNVSLNLPDDLIDRLTAAGLMTDAGIAQALLDGLNQHDMRTDTTNNPYHTLFEQTHDAVFMIGLDGRMMHVNRRAVELTGYSREELMHITFRELSAEVNESTNVMARLVRGEKVAPYERHFRTRSGDVFPAEVTAELVRGARGTPWYVQSVVRDITMRKQAETMLRDSERVLRQIIDLAPVHIFAKDHESRYIFANVALANAYRTTPDAMVGRRDADFTTPALARMFAADDRKVIETGEALLIPDEEYVDHEGRRRMLRTVKVPIRFPDRDGLSVLGVSTEITELKQAETTLRDSERLLRQIIDLVPVEIYARDCDGRYVLANKSAADAHNTTIDAMLGRTDADLLSDPAEIKVFREQDLRVLETGELLRISEATFTDPDGNKRILQTVKMPLKFPDRDDIAVLGVSTDITEMKKATEELQQAYRHAYELAAERQHVQILTQFIQDSSHEFRTPLSVIGTSLYLMLRAMDETKRAAHAAQATAQIERITRLLDHLQTMAELDSGIEFDFGPIDVNALIRDVTSHMERDASRQALEMRLMLETPMPTVTADVMRLRQALEHVIDNALRFTPHGGSVSISTQVSASTVEIEVRDTGVGIPSDLLPQAMRRFWRRDQAHSTPGFGLGLPIVQKIIERHNGTLALDSADSAGTTVVITLPIAP